MSNIEEDIKILENYLKDSSYKEKENNFFKGSSWEVVDLEIPQAMANVLTEFKKDKKRIKELEETKKYIVQLTDEQYRNLVDVIRKEVKKEYEQRIKDKIEKLKDIAKRIVGTYQYADSGDDLLEKKNRVIELRNKAEALENFLGG